MACVRRACVSTGRTEDAAGDETGQRLQTCRDANRHTRARVDAVTWSAIERLGLGASIVIVRATTDVRGLREVNIAGSQWHLYLCVAIARLWALLRPCIRTRVSRVDICACKQNAYVRRYDDIG